MIETRKEPEGYESMVTYTLLRLVLMAILLPLAIFWIVASEPLKEKGVVLKPEIYQVRGQLTTKRTISHEGSGDSQYDEKTTLYLRDGREEDHEETLEEPLPPTFLFVRPVFDETGRAVGFVQVKSILEEQAAEKVQIEKETE